MNTFSVLKTALKNIIMSPTIALVCFGIVAVVFFVATCGNPSPNKNIEAYNRWKTNADSVLKQSVVDRAKVDSIVAHSDSLEKINESHEKKINRLNASVRIQRARNDSIRNVLKATLVDSGGETMKLAENYREEADSVKSELKDSELIRGNQKIIIGSLRSGITILSNTNDSLTKVIFRVPKPKPEKFLGFLPQPTRMQSFVIGAVIGIAAHSQIK